MAVFLSSTEFLYDAKQFFDLLGLLSDYLPQFFYLFSLCVHLFNQCLLY